MLNEDEKNRRSLSRTVNWMFVVMAGLLFIVTIIANLVLQITLQGELYIFVGTVVGGGIIQYSVKKFTDRKG